jgi:hypothetical protein
MSAQIEYLENCENKSFDLLITYDEMCYHINLTGNDFQSKFARIKHLGKILNGKTVNQKKVAVYEIKFTVDTSKLKATLELTIHPRESTPTQSTPRECIVIPEIFYFVLNLVSPINKDNESGNKKKRKLLLTEISKKQRENMYCSTPPLHQISFE